MRTKRAELEAELLRHARAFRDSCDDGLGLAAHTGAYQAWLALSRTFDEYDALAPDDVSTTTHTANAAGPRTEHIAADLIIPAQTSVRMRLLRNYRIRWGLGEDGLTDSEMEFATKWSHTTVSSARNFLMNGGWIVDSGMRRRTPSRRPAIVWVLSPAGLRAFDEQVAAA